MKLSLTALLISVMYLSVQAEGTPRNMSAFVDLKKALTNTEMTDRMRPAPETLGTNIHEFAGTTFDLRGKGAELKSGSTLVFTPDNLVYAGTNTIESMMHRDMGPLAFYAIQRVYLLHRADGNSDDEIVGHIEFTYENGKTTSEEIVFGENIGNEKTPADWADMAKNGYCVAVIFNPVPYNDFEYKKGSGNAVKSVSIKITNPGFAYRLAAATCKLGRQKLHD